MNTKTTSQKSPKVDSSLILKVEEILGMTEKEISQNDEVKDIVSGVIQGKYTSEKDLVVELVKRNGENYLKVDEKLKQDRDVLQALLMGNPDSFPLLSIKQKKDPSTLFLTVESMVKSGKDIFQIEDFIKTLQVGQKLKIQLYEFYSETLSKKQVGKNKNIESFLSYFLIAFPELYSFLREKKFFEKREGSLKLSDSSKKILQDTFLQLSTTQENEEKRQKEFFTKIAGIFGIHPRNQDTHILDFLEWIQKTVEVEKTQTREQETLQEEGETEVQKITPEEKEDEPVYDSGYTYTRRSSGMVTFDISGGKKVDFDEAEIQNMSSVALRNYLSFLELFDSLGLGFLSRKYRNQFFSIGEVDYFHGEGITEGKILKLLNLIGKNIGIPQESYEDEEGNKKTTCFQTLAGAKLAFGDIRSTGKINGELVCEPSKRGNYTIVEIYMMGHQLLDTQGKGIMSYNWK